ncbi:hypothetical protein ED312_22690 [Sinomicrobium pectinilyticum]|uniref:Uncharacterized protein n=1 Tax=Sinomicrobium pectinilyticum TaxID=1084421 RepID=A0A3N0D0L6_SINP1|nr:hypothetical protein [Sinomicrobium pectinilyticum]RNL69207.1 hypothetical protein ED312_22690 [Sinomicrobium pectinilyticum]
MMRFFVIMVFFNVLIMSSCTSQIDIEKLQYGENVVEVLKKVEDKKRDRDVQHGVLCYRTEELDHFKYGDVTFSKYTVEDGYSSDYSYIDVYVDSYESNKYLGVTLQIANEKEAVRFINYLEKTKGEPEVLYSEEDINENFGKVYVWQDDIKDQVILLEQRSNIIKNDNRYIETRCVIAQKDVRVENSTNPDVFTLLEQFKMSY